MPTSSRFALPVSLDVRGRRCVVAGGGPLARQKAGALRQAGANVVEVPAGEFHLGLLDDTFLLIVSGEDDTDAAATFAEAARRGVLVNTLDDVPHCHFAFPSTLKRGSLTIAISTEGRAPAVARQVRLDLEEYLPAGLGALIDAYESAREAALPRQVPFDVWARGWHAAMADIDGLVALCEAGHEAEARDLILESVRSTIHADGDQAGRS